MGGGFASKAHYKKWYKKAYFAVLDFVMSNAFFAWNMSAEDPNLNCLKVKKFSFYAACAEEMTAYVDNEYMHYKNDVDPIDRYDSHSPILPKTKQRNYCVVCKLE